MGDKSVEVKCRAVAGTLLAAALVAGCQVVGPDSATTKKTLGAALILPEATLQEARHLATLPDSVNVRAFVVGVNVCPPSARCIMANGITLSDNRSYSSGQAHLAVDSPQQFIAGWQYLFSLVRSSPTENEGIITYHVEILGYD